MIETLAKAAEVAYNTSSETNKEFDPDKRIDTNGKMTERAGVNKYDPDKRIEPTRDTPKENIEVVGSYKKPRVIETKNQGLENDVHPITGVPFERRTVRLPDGEWVSGVFPRFKSVFDAKISQDKYQETDKKQFKECNKQILEAIAKDPQLKKKFSKEQIEQIEEGVKDGSAPEGYVWHHDAEAGTIQLVDAEVHSKVGHTGGRCLWGGGSYNR